MTTSNTDTKNTSFKETIINNISPDINNNNNNNNNYLTVSTSSSMLNNSISNNINNNNNVELNNLSNNKRTSTWIPSSKAALKFQPSLRQRLDTITVGPIAEMLILRVSIPELQTISSFKVLRDNLVKDLLFSVIKKKRLLNTEQHHYSLYLVPNNKVECGVWLDENKPLWIYELYDQDIIECKVKTVEKEPTYLKVVFPEQMKTKTFQVEDRMLVKDAIQLITSKLDVLYFIGQDLKYYGLSALLSDGSEILLQDEISLTTYSLGNMSIIEFKKKDIIVLCIDDSLTSPLEFSTANATGSTSIPSLSLNNINGSSSCSTSNNNNNSNTFRNSTTSTASSSNSSLSYVVPSTQVSITFSTKSTVDEIISDLSPWLESQIKKRTVNYKLMLSDPKLWLIENNPISSYSIKKNDKLYLFPKVDDNLNHEEGICLRVLFSSCATTPFFTNKLSKSLPGEILILKLDNVVHLTDYIYGSKTTGGIEGELFMTNYQLKFFSKLNNNEYNIPLYSISRIERVGSSKSNTNCYLDLHCKDFRFVRFFFPPHPHDKRNTSRKKLYKTLKSQLFPGNQLKLFAFYNKETYSIDGWEIFNLEKEYARQGIGRLGSGWRVTRVNEDYEKCDSYPSLLAVPERISDTELDSVFHFRSRGRIPALSWRHPNNGATITRCSQPLVGITRTRCTEDEKMFKEIGSRGVNNYNTINEKPQKSFRSSIMLTNNNNSNVSKNLLLLDARPKANAIGNRAMGAGYENTSTCYPECTLEFLNIENIHVMRTSLEKFKDTCFINVGGVNGLFYKEQKSEGWFSGIDTSHWFDHMMLILEGAIKIVETVHINNTSVTIHCSDGWDRTSQLSAISMLLLDPYYRTLEGFIVLIEKEWLSFGHKFAQRIGHGDPKYSDEQRSPVFLQFVECVYHILRQFPRAIEFNERLLLEILHNLFSCRFGTFLFNSERERQRYNVKLHTVSLWSYILSNKEHFINSLYEKDENVLIPNISVPLLFSVWKGYYLQNLLPSTDLQESLTLHEEIQRLKKENEDLKKQSQPVSNLFTSSTLSLPGITIMSAPNSPLSLHQ